MNKIIHLSAHLHCDTKSAFAMFTDNQQLESWLTTVAEVEPSVGGAYELFWQPDDRENNSTIGCKITAMESAQLLAFEWRSPQQFKHFANTADPLTHVVLCFIPNGKGTQVHLIHSGWRSTPEWEDAQQWQEQAWRGALQLLEKQINHPR